MRAYCVCTRTTLAHVVCMPGHAHISVYACGDAYLQKRMQVCVQMVRDSPSSFPRNAMTVLSRDVWVSLALLMGISLG